MPEDLADIVNAVDHAIKEGDLTPHQRAAFEALQRDLTPAQLRRFTEIWRAPSSPAAGSGVIRLAVPWFSQLDSATQQGPRMCFSSTCAMAAAFLKPGCLAGGGQPDDQYLRLVNRFGDTTDAAAQVAALQQLGIEAEFRRDGSIEGLVRQLTAGVPVPVGWLHRGPVTAPAGGGHWTLAIGWDPVARDVIMHDPNGEADLIQGGYVKASGAGLRYSAENWGRRWMAGPADGYRFSPGTGWWLRLSK